MTFGEKVKQLRKEKGNLSQTELANAVGVSLRTVRGWEAEGRYPKSKDIYTKLADYFSCDLNYLMSDKEEFITMATEQYGSRGTRQATELVEELTGLFAGGEMAEEDMDVMMLAIQQAYVMAKQKNKKYTPKKYLTPTE